MSLTPNDIEVLLHYHVSTKQHPRAYAPAVKYATEMWVNIGALEDPFGDGVYITTAIGKGMIEALCHTPLLGTKHHALRAAVANLIKAKGRHNTAIAYTRLVDAYNTGTPVAGAVIAD